MSSLWPWAALSSRLSSGSGWAPAVARAWLTRSSTRASAEVSTGGLLAVVVGAGVVVLLVGVSEVVVVVLVVVVPVVVVGDAEVVPAGGLAVEVTRRLFCSWPAALPSCRVTAGAVVSGLASPRSTPVRVAGPTATDAAPAQAAPRVSPTSMPAVAGRLLRGLTARDRTTNG